MKSQIEFEHGDATCFAKPGKFCRFLRTKRLGTEWHCGLFFGEDRLPYPLFDEEGWLQRCPPCLEQFPPPRLTEKGKQIQDNWKSVGISFTREACEAMAEYPSISDILKTDTITQEEGE